MAMLRFLLTSRWRQGCKHHVGEPNESLLSQPTTSLCHQNKKIPITVSAAKKTFPWASLAIPTIPGLIGCKGWPMSRSFRHKNGEAIQILLKLKTVQPLFLTFVVSLHRRRLKLGLVLRTREVTYGLVYRKLLRNPSVYADRAT